MKPRFYFEKSCKGASEDASVREALKTFSGVISEPAAWSDIPAHSDPDLMDALDKQAKAIDSRTKLLRADLHEALRRSYAEAGYQLVVGSFESGGAITTITEVLLYEANGQAYAWEGALPKVIPPASSPASTGGVADGAWRPVGDITLREELAEPSGAALVGGVPRPAASSEFAGGMLPANADNKNQAASVFQTGKDVRIESGEYQVSGPVISIAAAKVAVRGAPGDTTIKMTGSGTLLSIQDAGPVSVMDLNFDMSQPPTASTTHGIALANLSDFVLSGLNIKGLDGIGSGILSYSAPGTPIKNARLNDINIECDRVNSTNTNGFVLVDTNFSHARNVKVSGVAAFALELKNNSEHNIISDSSADNCNAGLYYGSDVVGKNPRYNVATGIIAKDCLSGYTPGGGTDNVLSGVLFDMRGITPTASTSAVRVGSFNSSVFGAHAVGSGNIVRYDAEARDNFTQISVHPTSVSFAYVAYEAGSERNVAEISHPGTGNNTIRPKISRPVGMPVSGAQSNPVYCHASGEYLGTLGAGWLWQHADITNTRASAHKWRFEGAGDSYLSLASDGLGSVGYSVSTPSGNRELTWLEVGPYWQLSGNNYNVRFYSSTIRPGADNTMDFGSAAFRGKIGFFAQGVQTTSDARYKSDVREMTAAELSAATSIAKRIGIFTWLADDSDRLHCGTTVQDVISCMESAGLDAFAYGFVCYDSWMDEYEDEYEEVVSDEGLLTKVPTGKKVIVREAGDIYSLRDHELYKFLIRSQDQRLFEIESRLTAAGL